MRGFRVVLASAAILLVCSELVESTSQNKLNGGNEVKAIEGASDSHGSVRRYESEDDEERKIADNLSGLVKKVKKEPIQQTIHIDDIPAIREAHAVLDPNKADELLDAGFLGWLGKADLDKVLHSNLNDKRAVFAKWHKEQISPSMMTELIGKNKAIEDKYKFVYVLYEGYVKTMQKKNLPKRKQDQM